MLAARDQENLVHGHQQAASSKPLNQSTRTLQPKTPGNRYPKTPLKIPLHDENAPAGFGGKATGKKTFDKSAFVTPMEPRTRAPLGMKTTNAKAKAFQTPGGLAPEKELERTIAPKTSARRPKKVVHGETIKLQVHGDDSPLAEREVEYCPPRPKDLPYTSEDFPEGCLNYNVLKPGNLMRGFYNTYHNEVDDNGLTKMDREYEASYQKSAKECDERIVQMMEEDWTVGDVPETFKHLKKKTSALKSVDTVKKSTAVSSKGPATISSRRAASALSVLPKSTAAPPKTSKPIPKPMPFLTRAKPSTVPAPTSTMHHNAAVAASRSTIGYNKGRSASNVLQKKESQMPRSSSNLSQNSNSTITPASYAENSGGPGSDDWRRLGLLEIFNEDQEDIEPGLRGVLPDCLRRGEDDKEEFVMTLGSSS